jgi:hypothetical protein
MFDWMLPEKHAIAILKKDHEAVKGLFDQFEKAEKTAAKEKIIDQAIAAPRHKPPGHGKPPQRMPVRARPVPTPGDKETTMATTSNSSKGKNKVHKVMKEHKEGTLKSGSGKKVRSRKQAVAIALSEARKSGAKIPRKKGKS